MKIDDARDFAKKLKKREILYLVARALNAQRRVAFFNYAVIGYGTAFNSSADGEKGVEFSEIFMFN